MSTCDTQTPNVADSAEEEHRGFFVSFIGNRSDSRCDRHRRRSSNVDANVITANQSQKVPSVKSNHPPSLSDGLHIAASKRRKE
ncbi:hypothetical protein MTO96_007840 [Rhipicephalus appendiculatus]